MNKRNRWYAVALVLVLHVPMHGMLMVTTMRAAAVRANSTKMYMPTISAQRLYETGYESCYNIAPQFRKLIAKPGFDMNAVKRHIESDLLTDQKVDGCDVNLLIENIVFTATHYKRYEKDYAQVLLELSNNGLSVGHCCVQNMLHEAVKGDLLSVTKELLRQRKELLHSKEVSTQRFPLHYAQSYDVAQELINQGADVHAVDSHKNTPLHTASYSAVKALLDNGADINAENDSVMRTSAGGWYKVTPLNKATDEGDVDKVTALLVHQHLSSEQIKIALEIAQLQLWRTMDVKYSICRLLLDLAGRSAE